MSDFHEKIKDHIYSHKEEIVKNLAALVAIESVKQTPEEGAPFGANTKKALYKMKALCDEMGFKTTVYENAVLCADYGEEPELGILAHLDVVPVDNVNRANWATNPFELTEKDGVLYGRGAIDDKGPAVAALWALNCVKELGIPLKKGVRLIFGTDEENGSEDLELYKKHDKFPPKVFTPDGSFPIINIEKGMMRLNFYGEFKSGKVNLFEGGSVPNAVPNHAQARLNSATLADVERESGSISGADFSVGEKSGHVEIVSRGKAAHASTPEAGVNAITALIALLNRVTDEPVLRGLGKLFSFGETDGASLGLKCADESGALTCVLSRIMTEQGAINGTVDIRFPTCANLEFVKGKLTSALENIGLKYRVLIGEEPHVVPEDSEFVQTLLSVYERVEGEKGHCIAIGGGTYVHNIEGGVAFGAERGDTDYHMHGDNEFITVEELLKDAVLFAEVIAEVLG